MVLVHFAWVFFNEEPVHIFALFFHSVVGLPVVEFQEFFVYFGYKFLSRSMLGRYFFPMCR